MGVRHSLVPPAAHSPERTIWPVPPPEWPSRPPRLLATAVGGVSRPRSDLACVPRLVVLIGWPAKKNPALMKLASELPSLPSCRDAEADSFTKNPNPSDLQAVGVGM